MIVRKTLVTACGALLGLALGVATLSASFSKVENLTFSGAVRLPGVTLPAGAYSFEVMDVVAGDVVCVRKRMTREPVFLGLTMRVQRADKPARSLVLGEAPKGEPIPIIEWFPQADWQGYQFVYSR